MDDKSLLAVFVAGVATAAAVILGFLQWRKSKTPVVPTPPGPSPVQKQEDAKVTEAVERAKVAKAEAEKLAGAEKVQALEKMHEMIVEDSRKLADDPAALNDYLLQVGKEIRNGG